jgi:hypothetical protein
MCHCLEVELCHQHHLSRMVREDGLGLIEGWANRNLHRQNVRTRSVIPAAVLDGSGKPLPDVWAITWRRLSGKKKEAPKSLLLSEELCDCLEAEVSI